MNGQQSDLSGAPAGSVFSMVCPAARQAGCADADFKPAHPPKG